MSWRPILTPVERIKLLMQVAPSREAARMAFDEFVAGGADDAEVELASVYYGGALFRLDGFR
jgi:hypothetical protein